MSLTFRQLALANLERCLKWHPKGLAEWSLSDWGIATIGELGEAANVIKKINRATHGLVGNDIGISELQRQLANELADTVIYLDLLAQRAGIDLEKAIIRKFNEVSDRNGFNIKLPDEEY